MGYECERSSATNSTHYTNLCAYVDYAIETTGCLIIKLRAIGANSNVLTNLRAYDNKTGNGNKYVHRRSSTEELS